MALSESVLFWILMYSSFAKKGPLSAPRRRRRVGRATPESVVELLSSRSHFCNFLSQRMLLNIIYPRGYHDYQVI